MYGGRPRVAIVLYHEVDDVRPLVASSKMSLAPIFSGGGTRLKILEAMALKTPVVATSKGAEGLDVESERHLLIADTAPDFADACFCDDHNHPALPGSRHDAGCDKVSSVCTSPSTKVS